MESYATILTLLQTKALIAPITWTRVQFYELPTTIRIAYALINISCENVLLKLGLKPWIYCFSQKPYVVTEGHVIHFSLLKLLQHTCLQYLTAQMESYAKFNYICKLQH